MAPGTIAFVFVALAAFAMLGVAVYTVFALAPWRQPVQHVSRVVAGKLRTTGPITIGGSVTGQGGGIDSYPFTVATVGQRLVMQMSGASNFAGIWEADSSGNPINGEGQVSLCGQAWCVHVFQVTGPMVIVVSGTRIPSGAAPQTSANGPYVIKLRPYIFGYDDLMLYLHRNSC